MIKIVITPAMLELFHRYRIALSKTGERLKPGEILGLDPQTRIESYAHVIEGRLLPVELGAFSYSHSLFNVEMAIGRYCSLSWGIEVMAADHPMNWASTSPFSHYPFDHPSFQNYLEDKGVTEFRLHPLDHGAKRTVIGNDVWIGMRALLKRGITIGHGAVIGAGSVVTKDVPPYAIVAGSPARLIRYRFPEALIARYLASEWWRYGPDILQPLDVREPTQFIDRVDAAAASGAKTLDLRILTGAEIMAAGEVVSS